MVEHDSFPILDREFFMTGMGTMAGFRTAVGAMANAGA
jgi:hypothetical protein